MPASAGDFSACSEVIVPPPDDSRFDLVHYCTLGIERCGGWIDELPAPMVVDCHDSATRHRLRECLHRLRWRPVGVPWAVARLAAHALRERRVLLRCAKRNVAFALLASGDRKFFSALCPAASGGVTLPHMDLIGTRGAERRDMPGVVGFYGYLDGLWNDGALRELALSVLPRIRDRCPEAELHIYGRGGTALARRIHRVNGVRWKGEASDIAAAVSTFAVACFPYRYGSGIKTKILECLAWGVPVVTTPVGAEGLRPDVVRCLSVAKRSREIADMCIHLLSDPKRREAIAADGAMAVQAAFNPLACMASYGRLYSLVMDGYTG